MAYAKIGEWCGRPVPVGTSWICSEAKSHGHRHVAQNDAGGGVLCVWSTDPEVCGHRIKAPKNSYQEGGYAAKAAFFCTLKKGHTGLHQAIDDDGKVWANWNDDGLEFDEAPPAEPEDELTAWFRKLEEQEA